MSAKCRCFSDTSGLLLAGNSASSSAWLSSRRWRRISLSNSGCKYVFPFAEPSMLMGGTVQKSSISRKSPWQIFLCDSFPHEGWRRCELALIAASRFRYDGHFHTFANHAFVPITVAAVLRMISNAFCERLGIAHHSHRSRRSTLSPTCPPNALSSCLERHKMRPARKRDSTSRNTRAQCKSKLDP